MLTIEHHFKSAVVLCLQRSDLKYTSHEISPFLVNKATVSDHNKEVQATCFQHDTQEILLRPIHSVN